MQTIIELNKMNQNNVEKIFYFSNSDCIPKFIYTYKT